MLQYAKFRYFLFFGRFYHNGAGAFIQARDYAHASNLLLLSLKFLNKARSLKGTRIPKKKREEVDELSTRSLAGYWYTLALQIESQEEQVLVNQLATRIFQSSVLSQVVSQIPYADVLSLLNKSAKGCLDAGSVSGPMWELYFDSEVPSGVIEIMQGFSKGEMNREEAEKKLDAYFERVQRLISPFFVWLDSSATS